MEQLISAREAAERIGVSTSTVKAWISRTENPLPAVQVGSSGRHFRIIANSIASWLDAEATRTGLGVRRGKE